MSNDVVVEQGSVPVGGLSEVERVIDTFVAPSKTFKDILRSASWWLPFVLMVLSAIGFSVAVDRQVGFDRVYDNILRESPKAEDRLNQLDPAMKQKQINIGIAFTKGFTWGSPIMIVISLAIYALILWAAFNFGLGAATKFWQVFAVTMYASLPGIVLGILVICTLYFGGNADAFNIQNPVGTNLGYYMPDASNWMKALMGRLDIIKLWSLALQTLGMAIIAKKSITQSAVIVVGLWVLATLGATGWAAMQ
jgi:hypothetical protein